MKSVDSKFCGLSRVTRKLCLKNMPLMSFSDLFFSNSLSSKTEIPFTSIVLGCAAEVRFSKPRHMCELSELSL